MNPTNVESAYGRITTLQGRLQDINALLIEVLGVSKSFDTSARTNIKIAIRALDAVRTDLESVCQDHLISPANGSAPAELPTSDLELPG